jgi:Protein of unknown function (DUF429)
MGDIAAHADWSMHPRKRWMTLAHDEGAGWVLSAPCPVGDVSTLLMRLRGLAAGGAVALGVDLPLGLPRDYARRHATAADFPAFLHGLADNPAFFRVCSMLDEVAPARPFYPMRGMAGMTRAAHAAALGLDGSAELSRACDRATTERPAGAPLFWTLGANQSGKAAIAAWRDLLLPALASAHPPRLWPFEGDLRALLRPGEVAIAETYPAEAMRHLNLKMAGSKRRQADRARLAGQLRAAMAGLAVVMNADMDAAIQGGFGADEAGEDRFDSTIGALCVLNVLSGNRPDGVPDDPWIRKWEGWVLGQTALPPGGSSFH